MPLLSMEGITKVYPNGFVANKDVNFSVEEGEIHALVGENGAGKSTLMKVLFGSETAEAGRILYRGKESNFKSPLDAIEQGIGMVHQHFMLAPSLTVTENIMANIMPIRHGFLDLDKATKLVEAESDKYKFDLDPRAKIKDLSVGKKQKVEILKALIRGAKLLILDEPTAVLTPQETKELFRELIWLKKQNYTIIFISHKLNEVRELCDRVTVLRRGKSLGVWNTDSVSENDISRIMVGRNVIFQAEKEKNTDPETILRIENLQKYSADGGRPILDNIQLTINSGEILGIAGVEGNGQKELSEIITGMDDQYEGKISFLNVADIKKASIRELRELGMSHISEDRMTYGVAANGTIAENYISDRYYESSYLKHKLLNGNYIEKETEQIISEFNIACDGPLQEIRMLSGGNMQKVVAGREFTKGNKLIIANQPTRGIDIGASELIRGKLIELRNKGTGVLLISADLKELLELSDRIIVMHNGQIVAHFKDARDLDEELLGEYMLGLKSMSYEEMLESRNV